MDNPNPDEENTVKWILIDSVENAEEVTETYDTENHTENTLAESDLESDGISIMSLNESSADEEYIRYSGSGASDKVDNVTPVLKEDTKKWTLSDSEGVSLGLPSKTFFLDCLREPIEELSEQELGTNQSNPKSDDIAIIRERGSDSMNDKEAALVESKKEIIEIQNLHLLAKFPTYFHKYFNGLVIGTILLATISIFLGRYLEYTDKVEDKLNHHKKNVDDVLKSSSDNIANISKKYNMMTTLYLCEQKFKSDNRSMERNFHECLVQIEQKIKKQDNMKKKEMEKLQKSLKIKEHYLNEKEKFLIKKEYELLKAEMKFLSVNKQHNLKNKNRNHFKFDNDHRSFEAGHDFEFEKNHIHKDMLKGNVKSKSEFHDKQTYKGHRKHKKDKISDSNEVLRTVQENFYAEKDKYFKMNHSSKLSKNKEQQRTYDNRAKKTKALNNGKANNELKPNYKHDKAQRKGKY